MICASITLPPPVKPRSAQKTAKGNRKYYTLHSNGNDAFTLRVNEQARTSMVGFREWDDAILVGKMLETYFIEQREWPLTHDVGSLILPHPKEGDVLRYLYIQEWNFDELKITCTRNFLDMISIENIIKKKAQAGYTFTGSTYQFEAEPDFYRYRLYELHQLNCEHPWE